ncbi:hypothetical protein GCM10007874_31770 [Labrys miyagiensis]|uniref:Uncharacterized protein n=1 Tax=Labrys miyagiensis TaxID=346912 RepID=A0ABQ6CJU0_9HYPH|nr:hypothetical protein [Labrys miyagiensis]GLS20160.1 hypothetical protein GCM10007874_31770 [Labrys miyagiensis]
MAKPAQEPAPADLENMTDEAIAACDGDARAAVRVLLLAMHHQQTEINDLAAEIARLAVDVSRGYSRGRRERYLTRTKVALPDGP